MELIEQSPVILSSNDRWTECELPLRMTDRAK